MNSEFRGLKFDCPVSQINPITHDCVVPDTGNEVPPLVLRIHLIIYIIIIIMATK